MCTIPVGSLITSNRDLLIHLADDMNTPNERIRALIENAIDATAGSPSAWKKKSRTLTEASQFLRERANPVRCPSDLELQSVAYMLAGMGIETLIKAVRLTSDSRLIEAETGFYSHDLRSQAEAIGDSVFTKEELSTLEWLTEMVEWGGRYPTPIWRKGTTPRSESKFKQRQASKQPKLTTVGPTSVHVELPELGDAKSWTLIEAIIEKLNARWKTSEQQSGA